MKKSNVKPWAIIVASTPLMAVAMILMAAIIPCCMYVLSRVILGLVSLFH